MAAKKQAKKVTKKKAAKKKVTKKKVTKKKVAKKKVTKKKVTKKVAKKVTKKVAKKVEKKKATPVKKEIEKKVEKPKTVKAPEVKTSKEKVSKEKVKERPKAVKEEESEAKLKQRAREITEKISDEINSLIEDYDMVEIRQAIMHIDFFNTNDSDECQERYCENLATTLGFCRLHYIKNWKGIKKKRKILEEGKLQQYIEDLINKFPPKYIEAILNDLSGDKQFYKVLKDLNIDNNFNYDDSMSDLDGDEDIVVETRSYSSNKLNYDDEDVL